MIACFSGTGNSLYVAKSLSDQLGDTVINILDPGFTAAVASGPDRIIWVFPVYAWGVPPVVANVIETQDLRGTNNWMVVTCGDEVGLEPEHWSRLITGRGGTTLGRFSVTLPDCYVMLPGFDVDSPAELKSKLAAAPSRIQLIAGKISHECAETDVVRGPFAGFKSKRIYPFFVRHLMNPRKFRCSDSCTGCGKCARECPTANITLSTDTRRPQWGDKCAFCTRCFHTCPTHAINWSCTTGKKGHYICPL